MTRQALFLTWNGAGNQPPAIALAQALRARGWQASFAGAADQSDLIEGRGFTFHPLSDADPPPSPSLQAHVARSWAARGHAHALEALCAGFNPDALIIDCMMFGVMAGAERSGLSATILVHSAPSALVPANGALERAILPALNALRRDLGLAPLETLRAAWDPFDVLVASLSDLDPPPLPPGAYAGPLFATDDGGWRSPWTKNDPRPLVLASFSTGRAWDQSSRIERTARALAGSRFRALFTTASPSGGGGANLCFLPFAPHRQVLEQASVTVCHAGHGTLMASLAAGVPLVCLPNQGADQEALARQVQSLGAGLTLDIETASAADILRAVERVATDSSFAAAAARLAALIDASPGSVGAARRLEETLLKTSVSPA